MKKLRAESLPVDLLQTLKTARRGQNLSQARLGELVGLPQMHISGIETGKIVPRYDTLLELVRVLGFDLLLVPRALVPLVQSLNRQQGTEMTQPLYGDGEADEAAEKEEGQDYLDNGKDENELS